MIQYIVLLNLTWAVLLNSYDVSKDVGPSFLFAQYNLQCVNKCMLDLKGFGFAT